MKLARVLNISRPRFWVYEFGAYIVGLIAAYPFISTDNTWLIVLFGIFFLIPANIFIYGINDIADYETDRLNAKKGSYEALVVPDEQKDLWKWILLTNTPFLLIAFLVPLTTINLILLLGFWFFAGFYSHEPIRAKSKPVIDSLFSGAHYVLTGIFGYSLITNTLPSWEIILAAMCWSVAMHVYSAIPDITADTQAGLKTLAILLGAKKTIVLCALLYSLAAILVYQYFGFLALILLIPYLYLMIKSFAVVDNDIELFMIYKKFPVLNSIIGMTIFFIVFYYQSFS